MVKIAAGELATSSLCSSTVSRGRDWGGGHKNLPPSVIPETFAIEFVVQPRVRFYIRFVVRAICRFRFLRHDLRGVRDHRAIGRPGRRTRLDGILGETNRFAA